MSYFIAILNEKVTSNYFLAFLSLIKELKWLYHIENNLNNSEIKRKTVISLIKNKKSKTILIKMNLKIGNIQFKHERDVYKA